MDATTAPRPIDPRTLRTITRGHDYRIVQCPRCLDMVSVSYRAETMPEHHGCRHRLSRGPG